MNQKWNDKERQFIRENAATMTDGQLAAALTERTGRDVTALAARRQRFRLGIRRTGGRGKSTLICGYLGGRGIGLFMKN